MYIVVLYPEREDRVVEVHFFFYCGILKSPANPTVSFRKHGQRRCTSVTQQHQAQGFVLGGQNLYQTRVFSWLAKMQQIWYLLTKQSASGYEVLKAAYFFSSIAGEVFNTSAHKPVAITACLLHPVLWHQAIFQRSSEKQRILEVSRT